MERGTYWNDRAPSRTSRRRLLHGGAGLAAGAAAFLLACGGDSRDDNQAASSLGTTTVGGAAPTVAAAQPKRGGKFAYTISTSANLNVYGNYHEGYNLSGLNVYDRPVTARLDQRRYVLEAAESIETPEPAGRDQAQAGPGLPERRARQRPPSAG